MTNEEAQEWVGAAVADGWSIEPMHANADVNEQARLRKDGYEAHYYANDHGISLWGDDRLKIEVPEVYDWDVIVAGKLVCFFCKKVGPTVSISFAGRCCPECREENKAKYEYPGWYN